MATIDKGDFDGLRNITSASGPKNLTTTLQDVADDVELLRSTWVAFLTKLDVDFVAQNAAVTSSQLDVDYQSTQEILAAAIKTVKGRV